MIRKRLNQTCFLLRLTIMSLPMIAFAVAAYLHFEMRLADRTSSPVDPIPYFGLLLLVTLVWAIVSENYGLCTIDYLFANAGKTRRAFLACSLTYLTILTISFFYKGDFSRVFIALSVVALFLLTIVSRLLFQVIWDLRGRHGNGWIKLLIIGADDFAGRTATRLEAGQVMRCKVKGFVRLQGQEVAVHNRPLYEAEEIEKLTANGGIDEIILALPLSRHSEIPRLMSQLEHLSIPVRSVLDFGEDVFIREGLFDCGSLQLLDLHWTPAESVTYSVWKRAFDLAFSTLSLILAAPMMALIAVLIQLTSPGPILFEQERVGLHGRTFRMYKFRTMRVAASNESNTRWTTQNDPRRTKLGAFLRATSLDELPQFFNVLRGDMSVVGPRPERPFFVQKFQQVVAQYNNRHNLKVGITGWAQVNGWRGDTSIAKRVECDLYYLRHWSLSFDLEIILLTLLRGLTHKNAY